MIRKYLWPVLAVVCFGACLILMCQINFKPAYGAPGDGTAMFQHRVAFSMGLTYDGAYLRYLDVNTERGLAIYKLTTNGSIVPGTAEPPREQDTTDQKGLAWDGSYIWMSIPGYREIWKVGSEDAPITVPNYFIYDITYHDGYLYEVDGKDGTIYKINVATGATVDSYTAPDVTDDKYFGLTTDGTYLYVSTYGEDDLILKYTLGGSYVSSFNAPCDHPHGLAYDGTYLWCVDDKTEKFYRFEK
jgi:hypothetical protein